MKCILCKIYFWKVFHMYYNFICTPIWTKFLFLQKVGVTNLGRIHGVALPASAAAQRIHDRAPHSGSKPDLIASDLT
jgi:hypothetical protein